MQNAEFRIHSGFAFCDLRSGPYLSLLLLSSMLACAPKYVPTPAPTVSAPATVPATTPPTTVAPVASGPREGEIDGSAGKLWVRMIGRGTDTVLVPLGSWFEPVLGPLGATHTVVFYDPRHRGRSGPFVDSTAATFGGDIDDLEAVRAAERQVHRLDPGHIEELEAMIAEELFLIIVDCDLIPRIYFQFATPDNPDV